MDKNENLWLNTFTNVTFRTPTLDMTPDNIFKKIGASDTPMYGPPKILACGHPPQAHQALIDFLQAHNLGQFPVVFVTIKEENSPLKDLLDRDHLSGFGEKAGKKPALIVSGFTENELRRLLNAYRASGRNRPLMATLTPTSKEWTVRFLLEELAREAEAMKNMQRNRKSNPE
jgi:hypothetical protein